MVDGETPATDMANQYRTQGGTTMPENENSANPSVASLWRYPVKSMMGEELNAADLTAHGVLGDRAYALIDGSDGKVVSAKNPRKWAGLFDFRAVFVQPPQVGQPMPPVRITLPDGGTVTSEDRDVDKTLSDVLGREVRLELATAQARSLEEYWPDMEGLDHRDTVTDEAMPDQTFFDAGIVHLLTTATLDCMRELYAQGRFEVRRFRPNIVVRAAGDDTGFVENDWIGKTVAIGSEARLNVTEATARCVMTTLPQGDLPRDLGILHTAARNNRVKVGIYANVAQASTIHRQDMVSVG